MVRVGDWVVLHEDSLQELGTDRISGGTRLQVTEVTDGYDTIRVNPPFENACDIYWNWEYHVVESESK